jgi:hypothetical protein
MHSTTFVEHALITTVVFAAHAFLLWIGTSFAARYLHASRAARQLWAKFVSLLCVVLVTFGNAALLIPRGSERIAMLIAISLVAIICFDWQRGMRKLDQRQRDSDWPSLT